MRRRRPPVQTPPELCGWGWGWWWCGGWDPPRQQLAAVVPSGAHRKGLKHAFTTLYKVKSGKQECLFSLLYWQRVSATLRRGKWGSGGSLGGWACTEVSVCFHLGVSALFSFRPTAEGKVKTWCKAGYDRFYNSWLTLNNNNETAAPGDLVSNKRLSLLQVTLCGWRNIMSVLCSCVYPSCQPSDTREDVESPPFCSIHTWIKASRS